MEFKIAVDGGYTIIIKELDRYSGKKRLWLIKLIHAKKTVSFPSFEVPDKFWLKKNFRDDLRNDLIKYVDDFAAQGQNRNDIFQNRDRVDRIVAILCTEIEKVLTEYEESVKDNSWKQLQYDSSMYTSIVDFLANLNEKDNTDIEKWIEAERKKQTTALNKAGTKGELSKEEVASGLLFKTAPKKPLLFFRNKLKSIMHAHKVMYEDLSNGKKHRFKEELIMCIATILSFWIGGDPKWVLFIGPSRSFKSSHINFFGMLHRVITYEVDMMTTNALMSGAEDAESFMWRLNEKTQLMDEMGTLLSMRQDQVRKLLGEYCVAYKGYASKISGSAKGHEKVDARYNWLAGITNDKFQEMYELFRSIGSRFFTLSFPVYEKDDWEYYHQLIDRKDAARVKGKETALIRLLGGYVYGFYKWLKIEKEANRLKFDTSKIDLLTKQMANFYALFRNSEPPLWFRQMIIDLGKTIALMDNRTIVYKKDINALISSTYSCNQQWQIDIIKFIAINGECTAESIREVCPRHTVRKLNWELKILEGRGLIDATLDGFKPKWKWGTIFKLVAKDMARCGEVEKYTHQGLVITATKSAIITPDEDDSGYILTSSREEIGEENY